MKYLRLLVHLYQGTWGGLLLNFQFKMLIESRARSTQLV
jgi:hypothetical protein